MLGGRETELHTGPGRALFVLAMWNRWSATRRGETSRIIWESIVVLLELIDLKEIIVSTSASEIPKKTRSLQLLKDNMSRE